jgi:hypothetical protein
MGYKGDYLHGLLGSTENSHTKYKLKSLPSSTRQVPDNKLAATDKTHNLEINAIRDFNVPMIIENIQTTL